MDSEATTKFTLLENLYGEVNLSTQLYKGHHCTCDEDQ